MRSFSLPRWVTSVAGLLAVLLTLGGCFLLRTKPDDGAPELTSQLSLGMSAEEVLGRMGPPQRRGYNLFDKKKEYWIYTLASDQKGKKQIRAAERDGQGSASSSELQLLFEGGKLMGWDHFTRH
ncbi:MAG: hypothetical protein HYZ81_15375 [Nitrospinae bacterium]|nr:hypothetical protein [Nitrospinota bacterium]